MGLTTYVDFGHREKARGCAAVFPARGNGAETGQGQRGTGKLQEVFDRFDT